MRNRWYSKTCLLRYEVPGFSNQRAISIGATSWSSTSNLFIDLRGRIMTPSSLSSMATMPLYPVHDEQTFDLER